MNGIMTTVPSAQRCRTGGLDRPIEGARVSAYDPSAQAAERGAAPVVIQGGVDLRIEARGGAGVPYAGLPIVVRRCSGLAEAVPRAPGRMSFMSSDLSLRGSIHA